MLMENLNFHQNNFNNMIQNPENFEYSTCLKLQQQILNAPQPKNQYVNYLYSFGDRPIMQNSLEEQSYGHFTQPQKQNQHHFKPIILLQHQPQYNPYMFNNFQTGLQKLDNSNVKVEDGTDMKLSQFKINEFISNNHNNNNLPFVPYKPALSNTNTDDKLLGMIKANQSETDSSSIHKNSTSTIPLRTKLEDCEDCFNNIEEYNNSQYMPLLNKKIQKLKKGKKVQQEKEKKIIKSEQKYTKRVNTSHVPLNMYNQLYFHLLDIYKNKMPCKCLQMIKKSTQTPVKIEENAENNNQNQIDSKSPQEPENLCKKCSEWKKIEEIKKLKKKNIETFRLLWSISKRVQVLSENFFLRHATISILSNKMYRTPESKQAVYTCLPNFVLGSRNYHTFYRILG